MVVGRDYTLNKPRRISAFKLFLDARVVPFAVNTAGRLEVALNRMSVQTGVRPVAILAGSTGLLSLILFGVMRRRSSATTHKGAPFRIRNN